jgi:rRNA-processing protein FCF1
MPVSFFKILSESTILYLYNTFYIDKRLSSVLSYDRRVLINQHVIEILHAITQKHRNFLLTNQIQQALIVVSQVVSNGNYSFSD